MIENIVKYYRIYKGRQDIENIIPWLRLWPIGLFHKECKTRLLFFVLFKSPRNLIYVPSKNTDTGKIATGMKSPGLTLLRYKLKPPCIRRQHPREHRWDLGPQRMARFARLHRGRAWPRALPQRDVLSHFFYFLEKPYI